MLNGVLPGKCVQTKRNYIALMTARKPGSIESILTFKQDSRL